MRTEQVESIAVLGAGVMGHGIAQIAAGAGYKVTIRDISRSYSTVRYRGSRGT